MIDRQRQNQRELFIAAGVLLVLFVCILLIGCQGRSGNTIVGPQGAIGSTGPQGSQGPSGPQGNPGIDATPVTVVQLCPGSSNYGTFVEVAFCIDGSLYATYSANGGFSTLLAPGSYSSNAINSSCSFTVVSGCEIQN